MRAVVLEKPGELIMKDLDSPVCGDDEVLIRVKACNICRTDVKCATTGQRDLVYPRILGHEIAGEIIKKGKRVVGYEIGQHVYVHPGVSCGKCDYCKQGLDNLCEELEIIGFSFDGGFQEVLRITRKGVKAKVIQIIRNEDLAFEEISFIEPLACCVNIQDALDLKWETVLVIIGGGRLGLLNLFLAKASGIRQVVLIEENEERRIQGMKLGFTASFSGHEPDLMEQIKATTQGHGVDAVIPCCPSPDALALAVQMLRKKGKLGYFSGITQTEGICAELNLIHYKEITVAGSYGCSIQHSKKAKILLESGKIDVRPLISHRVRLEALARGMEYVKNCDGYSTIVTV
jgi:L-iditol 2-dehydrogenase